MKSFLSAILLLVSVSSANASGGSIFIPSHEFLKDRPALDESVHPEGLPGGLGINAFSICKDRIFVKMAMWGVYPDVVQNRANLDVCYTGARYQPSLEKPYAYIQEQFYIRQGDQIVTLAINIVDGKCAEGYALSTFPAEYFQEQIGNLTCKPVTTRGQ